MPRLKIRKKTDIKIEKEILTGMIASKEYLQNITPLIDLSYFKSSFIKRVAGWSLDFYDEYQDAPEAEIQSIFNTKAPKLKEEEAELIAGMLTGLSKKYEYVKEIKVPYLTDETVKYFKQRELEITSGNIRVLLEKGDIKEAERQIDEYKKVTVLNEPERITSFNATELMQQEFPDQTPMVESGLFK